MSRKEPGKRRKKADELRYDLHSTPIACRMPVPIYGLGGRWAGALLVDTTLHAYCVVVSTKKGKFVAAHLGLTEAEQAPAALISNPGDIGQADWVYVSDKEKNLVPATIHASRRKVMRSKKVGFTFTVELRVRAAVDSGKIRLVFVPASDQDDPQVMTLEF